jgi:hypothetical protein
VRGGAEGALRGREARPAGVADVVVVVVRRHVGVARAADVEAVAHVAVDGAGRVRVVQVQVGERAVLAVGFVGRGGGPAPFVGCSEIVCVDG